MLESIFDMFVQASGDAKVAQGGLGIGLTLVRSLIERHGGTVEASSPGLNQGATFTVRLPLADGALKASHAPDDEAGWNADRLALSVLVVDDNRDAADSLCELLRTMCSTVLAAYSGKEGLELASGRSIDVAILDIGMPDMDGYELARALRALPRAQAMTLIALTGWGQKRDRQRLAAAGFQQHLLKPADVQALTASLRRIAGREVRPQ
jgi:CheY-like chemotaxis protein